MAASATNVETQTPVDAGAPEVQLVSPFPLHAVPRVWVWSEQFRNKACDDFAPKTVTDYLDNWLECDRRGRRTWAVVRGGEIGGAIWSTRFSEVVADVHVLFRRDFWGHSVTVTALLLACE
jgi:hypothetical protein